jgi:hypothetical protein
MYADRTDGEHRRLRLSRRGRRAPLVAALACLAIASLVGLASATTGPGYLLQVPRYRIALSTIKHYLGRYTTTGSARASKIVSSEVIITFAESGYPAGGISIYSYDAAGQEQSFAGTLYDFHQVGGEIDADIVTVGGGAIIGHLSVRHAGSTRNLVGTIDPPGGGGPFAISYRYAASAGPVPGQAYSPLPVPGPPNAGTVSGAALGQPGTTPPATAPKRGPALKPGWGSLTGFLGRYHVLPGPAAAPTPVQEGIFTVAVSDANRISAASLEPTGGELTLFLRKAKVKTTVELLPSGILSIRTPAGNYVLYLTMLESAGTRRAATVNQGAFVGAPLGTLTGTSGAGGTLTATVAATGVGKISARFVRFSANPQP